MAVPLGRRVLREVGGAGATLSLRGPKVAKVENFGKGTVDASLTKNALARAAFFNRLGEMRGRSSENQRYRASGLTMVLAAIILRNTVYLSCAMTTSKRKVCRLMTTCLSTYLLSAGNISISRAIRLASEPAFGKWQI